MVESGGGDVAFQCPDPRGSTDVGAQQVPAEHVTADGDRSKHIFNAHSSSLPLKLNVQIQQLMIVKCAAYCLLQGIHFSPSFPQFPFSVPSVFSFS